MYSVEFNSISRNRINLVISKDLVILRTRRATDPTASLNEWRDDVNLLPFEVFPEASVYLYKLSSKDIESDKQALIDYFRVLNPPWMVFIGRVMEYKDTGVYQIYTGNLFVKFHDDVKSGRVSQLCNEFSLNPKLKLGFAKNALFVKPKQQLKKDIFQIDKELLALTEVEYCHPELITKRKTVFGEINRNATISAVGDNSWIHEKIGLKKAWEQTRGQGIKIAIIDNGIDFSHPAFNTPGKIFAYRDMHSDIPNFKPQHRYNEKHGTPCAGIAASNYAGAMGIAPDAQIIPIRSLSLGSVLESEAFYWAANNEADIISCSWGPPDADFRIKQERVYEFPIPDHTNLAINYAATRGRKGRGCAIFFASGNGNESIITDQYASHSKVMAVGAINKNNQKTVYSDFESPLFCSFPSGEYLNKNGKWSLSYGITVPDRIDKGYGQKLTFDFFTGTSAACPGVAGIAALALSQNQSLSREELKDVLKKSCLTTRDKGLFQKEGAYHPKLGYGLLRADLAVKNSIKTNNQKPEIMKSENQAISLHIGINNVDTSKYGSNNINELYGCVKDMKAMSRFAANLGYSINTLENEQATASNILANMEELGNRVEENGILLITYAGHGVQLKDNDEKDEQDGFDESWVSYDRFLLDDEIYHTLAKIKKRIRVVVMSDSCNSESMTRSGMPLEREGFRERKVTLRQAHQVFSFQKTTIQEFKKAHTRSRSGNPNVFVKNLSACMAHETAGESSLGGLFTVGLLREYFDGIGYAELVDRIKQKLKYQEPNITNSHLTSEDFDNQAAFSIIGETTIAQGLGDDEISIPTFINDEELLEEKLFNYSGKLLVDDGKNDIAENEVFVSKGCDERSINGSNPWEDAYDHFNGVSGKNYVEPNIESALFRVDNGINGARSITEEGYLDTYPNPVNPKFRKENPEPFIWQLNDSHSQLRSASVHVFPEMNISKTVPITTNVVKIAHIDTGILPDHPGTPKNIEPSINVKDGGAAIDHDKKIAVQEQQGHGNATSAILAGPWIDKTTSGKAEFEGYFGAIPFARILPIKISESVILITGKRFAKAVDIAIAEGCDVITMSMAGLPSKVMAKAVNKAYENGIVIVSAAGNSWSEGMSRITPDVTLYPARYDRVISAVGAALNNKPYLVKEQTNWRNDRSAGGKYMQTCYGPRKAAQTAIAGYSPNIVWFGENKNGKYYDLTGGGTSSATPQIAAAAALYIQKHKDELKQYEGTWKKAEIVRQALFQSAEKVKQYEHVYGNGLLKAMNALHSEFAPSKLKNSIQEAKKAPERRRFLGGFFSVMFNGRSIQVEALDANQKRSLEEMLAAELSQLVYIDATLFNYANLIDLETDIKLDDIEFLEKIIASKFASQTLKNICAGQLRKLQDYSNNDDDFSSIGFSSRALKSKNGVTNVIGNGVDIKARIQSTTTVESDEDYSIEEIEIEIINQRSLNSSSKRSLILEVTDEEYVPVFLIEKVYESGSVTTVERSSSSRSLRGSDRLEIDIEYDLNQERGLVKDIIRKVVVKVFRWATKKILKDWISKGPMFVVNKIGDLKYDLMVYDLNEEWSDGGYGWRKLKDVDKELVLKEINKKSSGKLLLCLPGLLSKVQNGFTEFLNDETVRDKLKVKHCRYVLGFNMATAFHSVEENARELEKLLNAQITSEKETTLLTRSRGGIVARYLLEVIWNNSSGAKLKVSNFIMVGPPSQGTEIAVNKNWNVMFDVLINGSGLINPVIGKIITVMKLAGNVFLQLPGIDDMETNSDVFLKLNNSDYDRSKYFVFTSNFEPKKWGWNKLDNILDNRVFNNQNNDMITPVKGAIFGDKSATNIDFTSAQYDISTTEEGISHFEYLDPVSSKRIVSMILNKLG